MSNDSKVLFGNCEDHLGKIRAESVDLVFTSPPYFNQRTEYAEYKSFADYITQMAAIFKLCKTAMKPGGVFALNIGQDREMDMPSHMSLLLERLGFKYIDTICWNKGSEIGTRGVFLESRMYYPNFSWEPIYIYRKPPKDLGFNMKAGDDFVKFEERFLPTITTTFRTNVWDIIPERNSDHPAPFPERLAEVVIMCYSKQGDMVLDPFGGSGTTAVACEHLGNRDYILIERKKEYFDMIMRRLASTTGGLGL